MMDQQIVEREMARGRRFVVVDELGDVLHDAGGHGFRSRESAQSFLDAQWTKEDFRRYYGRRKTVRTWLRARPKLSADLERRLRGVPKSHLVSNHGHIRRFVEARGGRMPFSVDDLLRHR